MRGKSKKKFSNRVAVRDTIHPIFFITIILMLCAFLTHVIPAGEYQRVTDEVTGYELIDPDSFSFVERSPINLLSFMMSVTMGFQRASDIIFGLLIFGGAFGIINGTGALNVGLANLLARNKKRSVLFIPLTMLLFGLGSAYCANFEEFLVFFPIILACSITLGFDSITAVAIIFCSATAGYGGAITNAYTEGKAQEIAGIAKYSGSELRVPLFFVLLMAAIVYVGVYAEMVKKSPKLSNSYAYDLEFNRDKRIDLSNIPKVTQRQIIVLIIFLCGMIYLVYGITVKGYYIDEMAGILLLTGIICGFVGGLKINDVCRTFEKGMHDMLLPVTMIGLANSCIYIMEQANIMDTVLYYLSQALTKFPGSMVAVGMFVMHEIFNVFVPSGSAQAAITMPLMVPLADAAGITRQTATLAFQLGDAFTNILFPTSGEILAALAICRVPFNKWVKFLFPLFIIWWVISFLFIMYAVKIGF